MFRDRTVSLVIPAYNEEATIRHVVEEFRQEPHLDEIVVVDNNCKDRTAEFAAAAGARVVQESKPGYGSALMAGMNAAKGDLLVGDDGPDYDVLAAGADNEIPTYDSTAPLGLIPRSIADILTAEGIDFTGSSGGRRVVTIETYAFPGTASWTYTPTQSLGVGQGFIIFAMGQGSGNRSSCMRATRRASSV